MKWYPRPDSNRHASRRGILNPLRLPFRHLGPSVAVGFAPPVHAAFCTRTGFTTTLSQFRAKGLW